MRRLPFALAALSVLALSVPAQASTCPLISDAVNDVHNLYAMQSPALDIVSGGIVSDATSVTATLHVLALPERDLAYMGIDWDVRWRIGTSQYRVRASLYNDRVPGARPVTGEFTTPTGEINVPVVVDRAAATLTWTVPRSAMPELAAGGAVFTQPWATTLFMSSTADFATDGVYNTYEDGAPACA